MGNLIRVRAADYLQWVNGFRERAADLRDGDRLATHKRSFISSIALRVAKRFAQARSSPPSSDLFKHSRALVLADLLWRIGAAGWFQSTVAFDPAFYGTHQVGREESWT